MPLTSPTATPASPPSSRVPGSMTAPHWGSGFLMQVPECQWPWALPPSAQARLGPPLPVPMPHTDNSTAIHSFLQSMTLNLKTRRWLLRNGTVWARCLETRPPPPSSCHPMSTTPLELPPSTNMALESPARPLRLWSHRRQVSHLGGVSDAGSPGSASRAHRGDCTQVLRFSGFQRELRGGVPSGANGQNGPFLPWSSDLLCLSRTPQH